MAATKPAPAKAVRLCPTGNGTLLQVPVVAAHAVAVTAAPPIEINTSAAPSFMINIAGNRVVLLGTATRAVVVVTAIVAEIGAMTEKAGGDGGAGCA
jgi:hypothetical protein